MKNIILFAAFALMLIVAVGCNTPAGPAPISQNPPPVAQPQPVDQPLQGQLQPQPGPQQPQPGPQQPQPGQPQPGQPQPGQPPMEQPQPGQPQPGQPQPPQPQPGPQQPQPQPNLPPPPTQPPSQPCGGPPVIAFFNANPATITAGQSSTLNWGPVTNANSAVIDQGIGGVATPGSTTVKPAATTTYTLTAVGCGGTATRQVTVNVSGGIPNFPTVIGKIITWDLGIDEVYPSSTGKIIVRLKNTGPGALTNAKIKLTCIGQVFYMPPQPPAPVIKKGFDGTLSLNLNPGVTSEYETGISRDPTIQMLFVTCTFTPSFNDTNSGNNSLTRQVK